MRLTLRTLLAYMDDILEPADHEDLGTKIEASDFATELIHRSRDTVRRLRLGAPAVAAGDVGDDVLDSLSAADANVVAEYLDNTLPPEDVAEFERVCLEPGTEADMHLAEVASSHHVLTMVLGEPAEVDVDLRRRMYELPAKLAAGQKLRIEPSHVEQPSPSPEQAAPIAQPTPRMAERVAAEIPDYLRVAADASRRNRRWATVAAMLIFGGLAGWLAFVFLDPPESPAEVAQSDPDVLSGELVIEQDGALPEVGPEVGIEDANVDKESTVAAMPAAEVDGAAAAAVTDPSSVAPAATSDPDAEPAEVEAVPTLTPPVLIPEMEPEQESVTASVAEPTPPAIDPDDGTRLPPASESAAGESPPAIVAKTMPDLVAPAEQAETPPSGPVRLGTYQGNNDVLLRHDQQSDKWIRLPPRTAISSGDTLLTLPKFRTHVVLANVNAYLSGGTRLAIPTGNSTVGAAPADLELNVVYGRLLLNSGIEGARVAMQVDQEVRDVQLGSSASLAVEVHRIVVPGTDYLQQSAPVEAVWFLTSGSVDWPSATGDLRTIQAPAKWATVDGIDTAAEAIDELPEWIDREPLTDMERRARDNIAEQLVANEAVGLRLLELTDEKGQGLGRQREVRTLAAESGIHVGQFEPFVKALNDSRQNRAWGDHIKSLQQALALSPDVAARVGDAFVALRGTTAAAELMEMLGGYSAEAIGTTSEAMQQGALPKLIGWLEHDSLDYRVLAIHDLNQIRGVTGKSSLEGFRPEGTSQRRRIAVAKIWDRFESNELLPAP